MQTIRTLSRIVSEFGLLGWTELIAALSVAVGCIGELWIILNKLTRHVEPLAKNAGIFWRVLALGDSIVRPVILRLKIKGRRLPEAKEQLLERLFVMLVALGVGVELICLMFSLHEVATLNENAGQAKKEAGAAMLLAARIGTTNAQLARENLILRSNVVALELKLQPRGISPQKESMLVSLLKDCPKGDVEVLTTASSEDGEQFGLQIIKVLKKTEFTVRGDEVGRLDGFNLPRGIWIEIASEAQQPDHAGCIQSAFDKIGIHLEGGFIANMNPKLVRIWIGISPTFATGECF